MIKGKGIFIVLGMHRSGTSMVAGLLNGSGIYMGSTFRKPLPENPLGFFEEESFRILNDDLLHKAGYTVKEWSTDFSGIVPDAEAVSGAINLITHFDRTHNNWGWKDPRTCLTIPVWLKALQSLNVLHKTNIIVVERSVQSVSQSLIARGNVADFRHGEALCAMYRKNREKGMLDYAGRLRSLRVNYEHLVKGQDINRLEEFCGIVVDREFIDPSLDHSTKENQLRSPRHE